MPIPMTDPTTLPEAAARAGLPAITPQPPYAPISTTTTQPPAAAPNPRRDAWFDMVARYKAGTLDTDGMRDFNLLRQSQRFAQYDTELGLPPLDQAAAAPGTDLQVIGENVTTTPTTTGAHPAKPPPASTPGRGFVQGVEERARELMPKMVSNPDPKTGRIIERRGPAAAIDALTGGGRMVGVGPAQAVESAGRYMGLGDENAKLGGNITQLGSDALVAALLTKMGTEGAAPLLTLLSKIPGLGKFISIPRTLNRLPGQLRKIEQAQKVSQATQHAARTITKLPPIQMPPSGTIH